MDVAVQKPKERQNPTKTERTLPGAIASTTPASEERDERTAGGMEPTALEVAREADVSDEDTEKLVRV